MLRPLWCGEDDAGRMLPEEIRSINLSIFADVWCKLQDLFIPCGFWKRTEKAENPHLDTLLLLYNIVIPSYYLLMYVS